jgi:hypothetical protein
MSENRRLFEKYHISGLSIAASSRTQFNKFISSEYYYLGTLKAVLVNASPTMPINTLYRTIKYIYSRQ